MKKLATYKNEYNLCYFISFLQILKASKHIYEYIKNIQEIKNSNVIHTLINILKEIRHKRAKDLEIILDAEIYFKSIKKCERFDNFSMFKKADSQVFAETMLYEMEHENLLNNERFFQDLKLFISIEYFLKCGHSNQITETAFMYILRVRYKASIQQLLDIKHDYTNPGYNPQVYSSECNDKISIEEIKHTLQNTPKVLFIEIERYYLENNKWSFFDDRIIHDNNICVKDDKYELKSILIMEDNHYSVVSIINGVFLHFNDNRIVELNKKDFEEKTSRNSRMALYERNLQHI